MRMLDELLQGVEVRSLVGDGTVAVGRLEFDSRKVVPGTLFFATRGTQADGHAYIPAAVAAGAAAVVCEELPAERPVGVTFVQVPDSTVALGQVASAFYGHPSRRLKLVGVTGTNGKTTTATLLYRMFRRLGYKAGLISTVVYCVDDREIPSTHTTPDSIRLNAMMAEMVEAGCDYCFMEVSSHSLVQHRTAGLAFVGGIFSNITHDHLDYHKTFAEYIRAKKLFFDGLPAGAFALTNADDRNGMVMVQNTKATVKTYALQSFADFRCRIVETLLDGMLLNLDGSEVWVKFLGRFNAYNLTSVYATALLLDARRDEVLRILSDLTSVDGRFEPIHSKEGVTAIVDYAHTPDAIEKALASVKQLTKGKTIVVFGCGGDRDATKRPLMGKAALAADFAVVTSDNPRTESPDAIIEDIVAGMQECGERFSVEPDRKRAIEHALSLAHPGDSVLIAGKGHEDYQIIGTTKHPFDDRAVARQALKEFDQ